MSVRLHFCKWYSKVESNFTLRVSGLLPMPSPLLDAIDQGTRHRIMLPLNGILLIAETKEKRVQSRM
jgi:hypothetical protein